MTTDIAPPRKPTEHEPDPHARAQPKTRRKARQARPTRLKKQRTPKSPLVLTANEQAVRGVVAIAAALLLSFAFNLILVSHVQYAADQQRLRDHFSQQLADGVAPISEGDADNVLLSDGDPVAILDIPSLGLETVVVEGTASGSTMSGPGHRRDTVLPGQHGVSVIMGRASAYGGPFSRIDELRPDDTFTVVTGQGEQTFAVVGVRYPRDPEPVFVSGQSLLVLETAGGAPYSPQGIVRVDARLIGDPQPQGARQTTAATLPPSHLAMATDTSTVWALVFALQALLALELLLIWAHRRLDARQLWAVFLPVALLTSFVITEQLVRLLPNLL